MTVKTIQSHLLTRRRGRGMVRLENGRSEPDSEAGKPYTEYLTLPWRGFGGLTSTLSIIFRESRSYIHEDANVSRVL